MQSTLCPCPPSVYIYRHLLWKTILHKGSGESSKKSTPTVQLQREIAAWDSGVGLAP
jgi:hypothetical protein